MIDQLEREDERDTGLSDSGSDVEIEGEADSNLPDNGSNVVNVGEGDAALAQLGEPAVVENRQAVQQDERGIEYQAGDDSENVTPESVPKRVGVDRDENQAMPASGVDLSAPGQAPSELRSRFDSTGR